MSTSSSIDNQESEIVQPTNENVQVQAIQKKWQII